MSLISATDPKIRRHDIMVVIAFVAVTVAVMYAGWQAWRWWKSTPPYVDATQFPVRGIDLSAHNGMVNLDAAAASGLTFVMLKASEGVSLRDRNFRINYDKALGAGLHTGAYHFFRFDCGGVDQARNFLQAIGDRPLDLGLFIDVEEHSNARGIPDERIAERLTAMVEYLNLAGYPVTLYSNLDGYYRYIEPTVPGVTLWICSFKSTPPPLPNVAFWQYSHSGKVDGIRGPVDMNAFAGSTVEMENFVKAHHFNPSGDSD